MSPSLIGISSAGLQTSWGMIKRLLVWMTVPKLFHQDHDGGKKRVQAKNERQSKTLGVSQIYDVGSVRQGMDGDGSGGVIQLFQRVLDSCRGPEAQAPVLPTGYRINGSKGANRFK